MNDTSTIVDTTRYERGMRTLSAIDGEAGHAVVAGLADLAPDLSRYIVEFIFGDIYSRPALAPDRRQLVTLGALTAFGDVQPQLEVHINAALNVGLTAREIVEAIMHVAPFAGFPRVLNALSVARKVFQGRGVDPLA